jgi:hypothetical protein
LIVGCHIFSVKVDTTIDSLTECHNEMSQDDFDAYLHHFEDDYDCSSCAGCTFESDIDPSDSESSCGSQVSSSSNIDNNLHVRSIYQTGINKIFVFAKIMLS